MVLALAQAGLWSLPTTAQAATVRVEAPPAIARHAEPVVYIAQAIKYPPGYGPRVDSPTPQGDASGKDAPPPKSDTGTNSGSGARKPVPQTGSGTGR
jgi:hypothetical protein